MNAADKKELARAQSLIDEAMGIVDAVRDSEQEAFDDLSEKSQAGEKGEAIQERIDILETVDGCLADAMSQIDQVLG